MNIKDFQDTVNNSATDPNVMLTSNRPNTLTTYHLFPVDQLKMTILSDGHAEDSVVVTFSVDDTSVERTYNVAEYATFYNTVILAKLSGVVTP